MPLTTLTLTLNEPDELVSGFLYQYHVDDPRGRSKIHTRWRASAFQVPCTNFCKTPLILNDPPALTRVADTLNLLMRVTVLPALTAALVAPTLSVPATTTPRYHAVGRGTRNVSDNPLYVATEPRAVQPDMPFAE